MSAPKSLSINYVSPSIVRCGEHDFCLEYREPTVHLLLSGLESSHPTGGMLYFPTPKQWAAQYPNLIDQRERIKSNIINWSKESVYSGRFIADFLSDEEKIEKAEKLREKERASVKRAPPEQLEELGRRGKEFRERLGRRGEVAWSVVFVYVAATLFLLIYIGYWLKHHSGYLQ